ncbi:ankyrin repeat and protein kinase domain-containing protein [Aspergillus foveolatus]|uniref:ankyrin repeat and protein kinase domain-containing protein n=1 Tax=Aspergillus foveolatus TaxID=210207 RepID=UPI003CCDACA5
MRFDNRHHYRKFETTPYWFTSGWDEWSRFDMLFLSHKGPYPELDRTDRHIQEYDVQTLSSANFLGPMRGNLFSDNRHLFCPVEIVENESLRLDGNWKLPFLEGRSEPCRRGGFGHCRSVHGPSTSEKIVARKVFRSITDFERERGVLKELRECEVQDARIVLPLATVVVGDQSNILFSPARMDLEKFLAGGLVSPDECKLMELLTELIGLAGALSHLHTALGFNVYGCHADLKCANSLIYHTSAKRRDSGFILPEQQATDTVSLLRQMPGAYQAPEVRYGDGVSRSSDIWSFGCIMLDKLRAKDDDGVTNYCNGHFNRGEPPIVNSHIANWINNLPAWYPSYSSEFLQGCAAVLRRILAINKHDRTKASELQYLLGELRSLYHTSMHTTLESASSVPSVGTPRSSVTDLAPPSSVGGNLRAEDLFNATSGSDLRKVEACLAESVDIEKYDDKKGFEGVVQLLLQHNADCQEYSNEGLTCLHYTTFRHASVGLIRLLTQQFKPIDIPTRGPTEETPLVSLLKNYVPSAAWEDKVRALISAGADVNAIDKFGNKPIDYAGGVRSEAARDTDTDQPLLCMTGPYQM